MEETPDFVYMPLSSLKNNSSDDHSEDYANIRLVNLQPIDKANMPSTGELMSGSMNGDNGQQNKFNDNLSSNIDKVEII